MSCLCILEINPLSVAYIAIIFSHSESCLILLFIVSFAEQKLLSLIWSYLFIFIFSSIILEYRSKIYCCNLSQRTFSLCFPLGNFIVSGLTCRSLTHFVFTFEYGVRECINFIVLHMTVQFPSTTY